MKKVLLLGSFTYACTLIAMPMDFILNEFTKNYELNSNQSMSEYILSNEKYNSDYAFNNAEFTNNRKKRSWVSIGRYIGSGMYRYAIEFIYK
ncbi:hypothetical protein [Fluviispira multicolorata]|uniref:Uncharacterized protein n=1 Tax=Fluviispira multicolorata TaxID=2654512 RepID=A0A833N440_9BACT|nr:hypothetical protein [Fluviispira multicolorata]KAB8031009.1 hypothetical protein GCL57_08560 [Fluviispira multicolorata]